MNWVLQFFNRTKVGNYYVNSSGMLTVGSQIETKFGTGVIVGGDIHVRYDRAPSLESSHINDKTWTHNLKEFS